MSAISTWSTTAASNNSAAPDGWPESMAPSGVNDSARENMAAVRTWYENTEFRDWGHTYTYASGTTFTTSAGNGDTTAIYLQGRRIRAVGSSTGTIYGIISGSSHASVTTVTVVWDSGSLVSESLTFSVGLSPTGSSVTGITTRGDLMYRNANGPARLAVGSADQIMSSDGTDPTYRSGHWLFVAARDFATDATVEIFHDGIENAGANFVDGYAYKVEYESMQGSANAENGLFQLFEGSYRTGAADYANIALGHTAGTASNVATDDDFGYFDISGWGQTTGNYVSFGFCEFYNLASTSLHSRWETKSCGIREVAAATQFRVNTGGGIVNATSLLSASTKLKLYASSGTIDTGRLRLYRRKVE